MKRAFAVIGAAGCGDVFGSPIGAGIALGMALQRIIERRKARRRVVGMDGTAQLSEYVFHRDGAPVGEFKKSWATATKAAKCQGLLFHDLRRTCARRLLAAGVPTQVAKSITGHETDSIFSRYAIVDAALMLAAQEKVADKFPRRSQGRIRTTFGQLHQNAARASGWNYRKPFVLYL
jgi:hypothetical protein